MKSSGLEELEAINIDWKNKDCFTCFISMTCDTDIVSFHQEGELFDPKKKIQDTVDTASPFTLRYTYGPMR